MDLMQKAPFVHHSRKRVGRTSLWTINFSVFRRTKSCKVILSSDWLRPNPSKIYSSTGACSFRRIDFFLDEPKFLRNIPIFKRISAMYREKSIFYNHMCSALLRLSIYILRAVVNGDRKPKYNEIFVTFELKN